MSSSEDETQTGPDPETFEEEDVTFKSLVSQLN